MSDDKYDMHLIVPVRLVGPIMELLNGEGIAVNTVPHEDNAEVKQSKPRQRQRKMIDGIRSVDAVVITIAKLGGRATLRQVANKMTKHNPNSVSSAINGAVKEGFVIRADGKKNYSEWALTQAGQEHARKYAS